jgi:predicted dehydrogenase
VKFLIVGAGQLGSRHATSLAEFGDATQIHLVDPHQASLDLSESRIIEKGYSCQIFKFINFENVSGHFDLVVVATSSIPRLEAIQNILENVTFTHVLIEKLLVPSLGMLEKFGEIAKRLPAKAWVNCPMPFFPHYVSMRESLGRSPISYEVSGSNLGLITNAVHYIDHFFHLTGELPEDLIFLENTKLLDSKRLGYSEAVGTLKGSTNSGHTISISFSEQLDPNLNIRISNDSETWNFDEITGTGYREFKSEDVGTPFDFSTPFQSELTSKSIAALFRGEDPKWATLEDSLAVHRVLFVAIQNFVTAKQLHKDLKFT